MLWAVDHGLYLICISDSNFSSASELYPGQFMPWAVDHGLFLIRMSVSNLSHFQHLHQNRIHDGRDGSHLESLQLLSAPK